MERFPPTDVPRAMGGPGAVPAFALEQCADCCHVLPGSGSVITPITLHGNAHYWVAVIIA